MSIVGFSFININAERKQNYVGQVNVNNNITLKDVTSANLGIGDRGAIRITFVFTSSYEPALGHITLEGDVLVLLDAKQTPSILENWKSKRSLPQEIAAPVMNHILDRSNVQALLISKDLNLPSPVPLPRVQVEGEFQPLPQNAKSDKKENVKTTKVEKKKK